MNHAPEDPALIDSLAADYVLGTMRGTARARLERWRATSAALDARCSFWEERLMPLLKGLRPERPPAHVWPAIRQRLGLTSKATSRSRWPAALAASVVLLLALGGFWYYRTNALQPAQSASISTPAGVLMWQVDVSGHAGAVEHLAVRASTASTAPAGHDYELWALPAGGKPVSLGVLPYQAASSERVLTTQQRQALGSATQLAVSVEPTGGSPTGQPTGAVVFVVPLHRLS